MGLKSQYELCFVTMASNIMKSPQIFERICQCKHPLWLAWLAWIGIQLK